ncbi:CU044_2847 family protein [Streptomyces sp. NBRC 110611]|uniref:CU044_2847 family protein n=1 Tax=Streptomyces sp. NBRC 110611 TaxID=1621259 RepID=UPI001C66452C|nr:CU044_2847 family protein [Streptomyces sp. NBRC 110611]
MGDVALTLQDGTVVWLRAEGPETGRIPTPAVDSGHAGGGQGGEDGELELPDAFGAAQPVSVDSRMGRALTRGGEVLEEALRPLGGVLGQIHRSLAAGSHRPDEVTVEFGVTLGSDLSLGVFSGSGEASFTVSATWNLGDRRGEPGAGAGGSEPGGSAGVTGPGVAGPGGTAGASEPGRAAP